jgi:RHS repeat-associated protein
VRDQVLNRPPAITSSPDLITNLQRTYQYQATAVDPDGDYLFWQLKQAPAGMVIDPDTGVIRWQPSFTNIGNNTVIIEVFDALLQSATQEFTLKVTGQNTPPNITSNPITQVGLTQTYRYDVEAQDPENDPLTYGFAQRPEGMTIDEETGLIAWQPTEIGSYKVEVTVTDTQGGISRQIYTLEVLSQPINQAPVITSTPGLRADLQNPYSYQIAANDPDGDRLTYQLLAAPDGMSIDSNAGIVRWQPKNGQLGVNSVTVAAYDPQGLGAIQTYKLAVLETNNAPLITSLPNLSVVVGSPYRYDLKAIDPDGDAIAYTLTNAPEGVTLDELGRLRWSPLQADIGAYPIEVTVTDGRGLSTSQTYTLTVIGDTEAPEVSLGFNSSRITIGKELNLQVSAIDNVGVENITLMLGDTPLSLNPGVFGNAQVNKTAITLDKVGTYQVVATAVDAAGNVGTQTLQVEVVLPDIKAPIVNINESIFKDKYVLAPGGFAQPEDYNLTLSGSLEVVKPQAGNVATFTGNAGISSDGLGTIKGGGILEVEVPTGSKIEYAFLHLGTLTTDFAFRPNNINFEGQTVGLSWLDNVQDMSSFTKSLNFEIGKADVTSIVANKVGNKGGIFEFNLSENLGISSDLIVGSSLTVIYSNPTLPASTIVLLEGGAIGADPRTTNLTFANLLDLTNSQVTPQLSLGILFSDLNDLGIPQYTTVDINGDRLTSSAGNYDDGVRENYALITVGGVGDNLDNPDDPYAIRDVSDDELYNLTPFLQDGDTGLTIETRNPSNDDLLFLMAITLPVSVTDIKVTNPDPVGYTYNKLLTATTDIVATISDENLTSYRVEYAPIGLKDDSTAYKTIAQGTSSVDGVLGQLDPKLLENGDYQLRVVAIDSSGNVSVDTTNFSIGGENKPGRFELEFVDLSVPLTGIPIEIYRRYDSLESDFSGDFGHGWTLGIQDARIEETSARGFELGGKAIFFDLNPLAVGDRVTLTTPEGKRVGFTFEPQFVSAGAGIFLGESAYVWRPYFRPDPGVYETLEVDYMPLNIGPDGSAGLNLFGFSYNPNTYRLITKEGITYQYDQYQGLQKVTDRNGNTLTYTDAGIFSSTGQSITFKRDAQGRITEIIDPDGKALKYSYDANGDLIGMSDRTNAITQFEYESTEPHYLTEIIDPLGRTGVRTEYDENGQISKLFDADGNALNINYDSATSRQTVKDPFGNTTTYVFDPRGNVVSQIDALAGVTARTYDANNNLLSETNPEGNTKSYTYDSRGNKLSETDGEGNTKTYTYNQNSKVLTETDALGNTTTYTYDANDNLTSRKDAIGNVTTYKYGQYGLLTEIIDANSKTSKFSYDFYGNLTELVDPTGAKTQSTYDKNGRVASLTNALGAITNYVYDAQGRLIQKADPEGSSCGCARGIVKTEYNAAGEKIAEIDALGRRTEYRYSDRGLLIETILPDETPVDLTDNPRTKNEYDALDRLIVTVDELGRKTHYIYDKLGRQIEVIYPDATPNDLTDNPRTKKEYDKAGLVIAEIDELGNRTELDYDKADRLIARTNALNEVTTYTYDANGRQIAMTDGLGRTTNYAYDGLDRLISTTYANNAVMAMTYDPLGRIVAETDLAGKTTNYEYDALGRLTAVVDALNQRTEYKYDAVGNLIEQKDANNHVTKFEYDSLSRRKATILPGGQRNETIHNTIGNLIRTTDFNGATTTYKYDARNRIIEKSFSDGTPTETFTYTLTGELASVTDNRGVTTYSYDERDRLLSRTEPDNRQIQYTYDAAGNILSLNVPSGTTRYTYDKLNRIDTVIDPDSGITDYTYDKVGNLIKTEFPNGVSENQQYDLLNRLTYLENRKPTGIVSSYTYTLDAMGNRTKVVENDGRTVEYTYDDLYRLTQEKIADAVAGNKVIDYKFDPVGNRLERIDSVEGKTTYSYDANDRLLEEVLGGKVTDYQYDAKGNLTAKIENGQTQAEYEWNAKGELVAVEVAENGETGRIEFEYDHQGVRVAIKQNGEETRFLIDKNQQEYAQVIEEYQANATVQNTYVHGIDLISKEDANRRVYYQVDGLGSTRLLTDNNGAIVVEYDYDAYGNLTRKDGDADNNYLFTGEQYDSNFDGYYLRARYYDPATGRFVSTDPFEGFNDQPVTLHDYLYGNVNPVNRIDPSGFSSTIEASGSSSPIKEELDIQSRRVEILAYKCLGTLVTDAAGALAIYIFVTSVEGFPVWYVGSTQREVEVRIEEHIKEKGLPDRKDIKVRKITFEIPKGEKWKIRDLEQRVQEWMKAATGKKGFSLNYGNARDPKKWVDPCAHVSDVIL